MLASKITALLITRRRDDAMFKSCVLTLLLAFMVFSPSLLMLLGNHPIYAARAISRPLWMMRRFGSVAVLEAACR